MKTILVDALNTLYRKEGGIDQAIFDLLESRPNRKIILSNANDEEIKTYGMTNTPYDFFTLKHAPNKTDSKYYQSMLEHFALTPNDVIYFEHNPEAVKSAESVGIVSHHFDPIVRDLSALKSFLDENLGGQSAAIGEFDDYQL